MKILKALVIAVVLPLVIVAALMWKALIWVIAGFLSLGAVLLTWSYLMANDDEFFDDLF